MNSKCEIDEKGNKFYVNDKRQLHREDGPAVELVDGTKRWYINNQRHRSDGPAVIYANGDKEWWVNHKLHRLDGPAIEWVCGVNVHFIDYELVSEAQFPIKVEIFKLMEKYAS